MGLSELRGFVAFRALVLGVEKIEKKGSYSKLVDFSAWLRKASSAVQVKGCFFCRDSRFVGQRILRSEFLQGLMRLYSTALSRKMRTWLSSERVVC